MPVIFCRHVTTSHHIFFSLHFSPPSSPLRAGRRAAFMREPCWRYYSYFALFLTRAAIFFTRLLLRCCCRCKALLLSAVRAMMLADSGASTPLKIRGHAIAEQSGFDAAPDSSRLCHVTRLPSSLTLSSQPSFRYRASRATATERRRRGAA